MILKKIKYILKIFFNTIVDEDYFEEDQNSPIVGRLRH